MYFTPELFRFLRDLKRNNKREWFAENRQRYETHYRQAMLDFLKDLKPRMRSSFANYEVDLHPSRGSFLRIYRDVRFSPNKAPYKTHLSAHFSHIRASKKFHVPSLYFHIEKGECFLAAGIWQPDGETLKNIRARISLRGKEWKRAIRGLEMSGSSLQRAPKGWDPNHPHIDEIKRKDFICILPLTEKEVLSRQLPGIIIKRARKAKKLLAYLEAAVEG